MNIFLQLQFCRFRYRHNCELKSHWTGRVRPSCRILAQFAAGERGITGCGHYQNGRGGGGPCKRAGDEDDDD